MRKWRPGETEVLFIGTQLGSGRAGTPNPVPSASKPIYFTQDTRHDLVGFGPGGALCMQYVGLSPICDNAIMMEQVTVKSNVRL